MRTQFLTNKEREEIGGPGLVFDLQVPALKKWKFVRRADVEDLGDAVIAEGMWPGWGSKPGQLGLRAGFARVFQTPSGDFGFRYFRKDGHEYTCADALFETKDEALAYLFFGPSPLWVPPADSIQPNDDDDDDDDEASSPSHGWLN